MKKQRITAAVAAVLLLGICANADTFNIKNEYIQMSDTQSELIPLRYAAENCGYSVEWNGNENSVALSNGKHTITININDKSYLSDEKQYTSEYAPMLIGDKTYISPELALDIFNDKYITKQNGDYCFADKPVISSDNMMKTIREISEYPRSYLDATHTDAMNYVINKFKEYGYTTKTQNFDYEYFDWNAESNKNAVSTNIIAVKKANFSPTGDILIVGAHYDGAHGVPAANDNGSGLAVMLELAKALKDLPTDTEIRFVAFDAEETGLNGSKEYVKTLSDERENITGMINFDMLGAAKAEEFGVYSSDNRKNYLYDILNSCAVFDDIKFRKKTIGLSDHMSFASQAIPNINFSHESIHGEYHCENDVADNINPDNLQKAADGGYYIISNIMSNLTSSFKEKTNSVSNEKTVNITYDTIIPTACTRTEFEKAIGTELTQVPSDNSDMKYVANINLFDFEKPLTLTVEGQSGTDFVANPHIEFGDTSFEEIKSVLDRNMGNAVQKNKNYFYNTIYGNCYVLYYDSQTDNYTFAINDYWDFDKEAYAFKDGTLTRMDNPELIVNYTASKINGKIEVTETKSEPSGEAVSERMFKCFEKLKQYLSEFGDIDYIVLKTDGLNNSSIFKLSDNNIINSKYVTTIEIPDEYKYLPGYIQESAVRAESRLSEGETATIFTENMSGSKLYVDYLDFLNENGSCYTQNGLLHEISLMQAQNFLSYDDIVDVNAVKPDNPSAFENATWNLKKDGFLYKFAEKFYKNIYSDDKDLYAEYPDEFLNETAAINFEYDFQISFAAFVTNDKPSGSGTVDEKIRFFYEYPEFVQIRDTLRKNIK